MNNSQIKEKTREPLGGAYGLPTQIEYIDGDTTISLPDELGGGTIVETEYCLTPSQLTLFRALGLAVRSTTIDFTDHKVEKRPETVEEHLSGTNSARVWEASDTLRIVKPLADFIAAKQELGHELNLYEASFLTRFHSQQQRNNQEIAEWDGSDNQKIEKEDLDHIVCNIKELDRRKTKGLLYQDGTSTDTYSERNRDRRRKLVMSGAIFTDAYRQSKLGKLTMDFLGHMPPGDIDQEWQGVAAADALLAGQGILTDGERVALNNAARSSMAPSSYWAVLEARQMKVSSARPRLTHGDGQPVLSRPGPGQ